MRIGCIAHPRYKDKNSKDREGREVKRDQDGLLSTVKPMELRKIFLADLKHKKSLLSAGKDHMLMKYASLMKIQFPKHRQGVVDGLIVLMDMPYADVAEKLDIALHRLRQPSESDDGSERKRDGTMSASYSTPKESTPRFVTNGKLGLKRQRSQTGTTGTSEDLSPSVPDNSQLDHSGDVDANDLGNLRGMTREERKLRETLKLFARMEERQRDKKRPRVGDNTNSPKSGLQSRPKTPRTGSRTTSKPGTPNTPVEWDERKSRVLVEGSGISAGCAETSRKQDGDDDDDDADLPSVKDESPHLSAKFEKSLKFDSRNFHKSTSSCKSEAETGLSTPKRDRLKSERITARRKDNSDICAPAGPKKQLMSERTRSHDLKRRKIGGRDGYVRNAKDEKKIDPTVNFSLHVPGPTVLLSKLVPDCRLSRLELEARKQLEGQESAKSREFYLPLKKVDSIRREYLPWEVRLIEATPVKKRLRVPLAETEINIVHSVRENGGDESGNDDILKPKADVGKKNEPDSKPSLPSTEIVGEWKKFCLKKRKGMLNASWINGVSSNTTIKDETVSEVPLVISPVSPSGVGMSSTPTSDVVKNGSTSTARDCPKKPLCSPKLRSSPVSATRTPRLRSVLPPVAKRARLFATGAHLDRANESIPGGRTSALGASVGKDLVEAERSLSPHGNDICKIEPISLKRSQLLGNRGINESGCDAEEGNDKNGEAGNEKGPLKGEIALFGKFDKPSNGTKKPIPVSSNKLAPPSCGNGLGVSLSGANIPRKSFPSRTGISIRSVPISQMSDVTRNMSINTTKPQQITSTEVSKIVETKKVVEGTIDILQQRLECYANPTARGDKCNDLGRPSGVSDSFGANRVAVDDQAPIGVGSSASTERLQREGGGRGLNVGGIGASERPTSDTREGRRDNVWNNGALPSFASHKRTHGYHHMSNRLNRGNGTNGGLNGGGGVPNYGLVRTDDERKGWNRGHEGSYRGGTSYGWGDGAGRNGRRRRQLD